jgi:transposase
MRTISLDLRTRILATYDGGGFSRKQVAQRFRVSEGLVKKLLQQRSRLNDIAPRHHCAGNKPRLRLEHGAELQALIESQPDLTLEEIRERLGLTCTPQAIHYVLIKMGLTYKKRRCMPPSKTAPTSRRRVPSGKNSSPN